jgi:hypothetical protein
MTGETVKFEKPVEGGDDAKREQSTIAFPYLDLDSAIEVARAIYNRGGTGGCTVEELAAEMNQTVSGAFRLKTGTAKTFDLVAKEGKSGFKLNELGRQIIAQDTERAARAESFMRVPLYAAVYDKYKGHLLPPPKALEREMQGMGVSSKQTDKARQAFERSAKQAGYFESGEDRLVRPRAELPSGKDEQKKNQGGGSSTNTKEIEPPAGGGGGDGGGRGGDKSHPLIQGLLLTLPPPGEAWDADGRANWLRMAASIFDNIYKGPSVPLTVTPTKTATP